MGWRANCGAVSISRFNRFLVVKKFLQLSFLPVSSSLGLLILRLLFGGGILGLHGWSKIMNWGQMSEGFPDPLGMGSPVSLAFAILAEVVAAALIVLGLCTRWAALGLAFTMGVAFFMVHGGALSGEGSGEMAAVYGVAFLVLFLTGAGKISIDAKLNAGAAS